MFVSSRRGARVLFHFCTLSDLKCTDLWGRPAPLVGEIDICARGLFCVKFNSEQLLSEPFLDVMRIFGSVEPQSESNFPFLYKIQNILIFGDPYLHSLREIDMCAQWLFCTKCNAQILLFEQFFNIISNFGSVRPENESTFPSQYNIISTPGGNRHEHPLVFFYEI